MLYSASSEPSASNNDISTADEMSATAKHFRNVLDILRDARLSPFDLVLHLLDKSKDEYAQFRSYLYDDDSTKLFKILDLITEHTVGRSKFQEWLRRSAAFEVVTEIIHDEMERVRKADLLTGVADITPTYIQSHPILEPRRNDLAPCLIRVLTAASQTNRAREENKKKEPLKVRQFI